MNDLEKLSKIQEFTTDYENAETPSLPERLTGYHFISWLSHSDNKKTMLLETPNGQRVLCKFASGEYKEMLQRESHFFKLGKFSFVPYMFDYFETEDGAYLLREYIEGQTFDELIEKNGPLPLAQAIPLIKQVCDHLSRFHKSDSPIIHRDLKPSNIVVHPSGDCYLIDLGTFRTYDKKNTSDTMFMGTASTAAPEQFGARQTDERTDVYGVGILLYFLLTGELRVEESHLKELPKRAAKVIKKCTAFDPDDRYRSVSQTAEALSPSLEARLHRVGLPTAICAVLAISAAILIPRLPSFIKVDFSSSLLEQAVRESLNKPEGEPIYQSDLKNVTHIYVCGDVVYHEESEHFQFQDNHNINGVYHTYGDIEDISILAKMTNLQYVTLDYQQIQDISPLKDLHLIKLSLCGNPIEDLSPLSKQTQLTELYASGTSITLLDPIQSCEALIILDCSYSPVTSLKPITQLPIRSLFISDIQARDFEEIIDMPIANLYCRYLSSENFLLFGEIDTLENLTLHDCGITSINDLYPFKDLIRLDLRYNSIENLNGIEEFTNLKYLVAADNPITDASALSGAARLTSLDIASDTELDFTFLKEMPWIQDVSVSVFQEPSLYEAVPVPWFNVNSY